MHLLVHLMMPSTDPVENTVTLWTDIKAEYKEQGTESRFSSMKMSMFSPKGCAKLRGTAANIKAIGKVLYKIWLKYYNPERLVDQRVELAIRTGCHLEAILDRNKDQYVLPGLSCIVRLLDFCFCLLLF
jgi:hypothetical protein